LNIDFSHFHLAKTENHPDFTAEWWQRKK
jgi:hypothetical protein